MANILIVDDEVGIRELLSEILSDEGHDVQLAENAAMARSFRNGERPDLVLLDIWMPDTDGITLLKEWSANGQLTMPVIMMSGHGTIDTAVEATRIGAIDYLEKPIALQKLLVSVKRGLLRPSLPGQSTASALSLTSLNRSVALRDLKRRIQQLAEKSRMLLLRVGPGSMAELIARSYQNNGSAWMDLSVISLPLDIKQLQNMAGGVLFVPELGKLTRAQQKNLAFAAERLDRFNLHLIVATEFSPEDLVKEGWDVKLIKHLFEVSLIPPTLADIQEDIPDLASQLLGQLISNNEIPQRVFSQAALNSLRAQPWSGGFIELRAAVKSLALGALEEEIGIADVRRVLPPHASSSPPPSLCLDRPLREAREAFERMYFEHHLQLEGNNMTRIAEKCGLERTHLYRKLKQLGLQISRRNDDQDSRSAG